MKVTIGLDKQSIIDLGMTVSLYEEALTTHLKKQYPSTLNEVIFTDNYISPTVIEDNKSDLFSNADIIKVIDTVVHNFNNGLVKGL